MNSFKRVRAFQIELELEVLVFEERENRRTRRKVSRSKGGNQQQTQPTCGVATLATTEITEMGR